MRDDLVMQQINDYQEALMTVATSPLVVNGDRLNRSIMELAEVGQLANGGVCRIAFSTEDRLARQRVQN